MNAKDGTLDQLARGVETLALTGQALNTATLPRLNRAVEDTARAARQVSRAVKTVNDNPQSLIFGQGPIAPGPGEAGFTAPAASILTGPIPATIPSAKRSARQRYPASTRCKPSMPTSSSGV